MLRKLVGTGTRIQQMIRATKQCLFLIWHCLDSNLWVWDDRFTRNSTLLASCCSNKNGVGNTAPELWISESLGLVPGKFYHSLLLSKDRQIVDSLMNRNSGIVQGYRLRILRSRNVEQMCPKVTTGKWYWTATVNNRERLKSALAPLQPPTSLLENVCAACNGRFGLAVFRSAGLHTGNFQVKVLYRVNLTYQPKGPEALNPISII